MSDIDPRWLEMASEHLHVAPGGRDIHVCRLADLLSRVAAEARAEGVREGLTMAAADLDADARCYAVAIEITPGQLVPAIQVPKAMAAACRTASLSIRALVGKDQKR